MVPTGAQLMGQLVESDWLWRCWVTYLFSVLVVAYMIVQAPARLQARCSNRHHCFNNMLPACGIALWAHPSLKGRTASPHVLPAALNFVHWPTTGPARR